MGIHWTNIIGDFMMTHGPSAMSTFLDDCMEEMAKFLNKHLSTCAFSTKAVSSFRLNCLTCSSDLEKMSLPRVHVMDF